jgi:hypothetical protein
LIHRKWRFDADQCRPDSLPEFQPVFLSLMRIAAKAVRDIGKRVGENAGNKASLGCLGALPSAGSPGLGPGMAAIPL